MAHTILPKPSFLLAVLLLPLSARCLPRAPPDIPRRQLDSALASHAMSTDLSASLPTSVTTTSLPSSSLAVSAPSPAWPNPILASTDPDSDSLLLLPPGAPIPPIPTYPSAPTRDPTSRSNLNPNDHPNSPTPPTRPLVMAYYPAWAGGDYPPEKIDFSRFDWIDFAFAVPDQNMNLSWDGSDDAPDLLRRLVSQAHNSGKRVKLSVGGWTGSKYFSSAAASPQSRETLVNNILTTYTDYNLDGIDIDWEYPGQPGDDGNLVTPDDSADFLEFLRLLRATLPPQAAITAATQTVPFAGADGEPMVNVPDFAAVLDWVLLMNYDTWGSSSKPGPNAPLSDACNNSTQVSASALSALDAWTAAGFSASQLVLGVPSYGYISRSTESMLQTRHFYRRRRSSARYSGRRLWHRSPLLGWVSSLVQGTLPPGGTVRVANEDGSTDNGQVQFRDLVRQGVLQPYASSNNPPSRPPPQPAGSTNTTASSVDPSDPLPAREAIENGEPRSLFAGGEGFVRMWDACSSTPYLRSESAGQIVTYDDPVSLEMKAQLVREAGMRGVNMFDVHGDTDDWDLTDALRRGLQLM